MAASVQSFDFCKEKQHIEKYLNEFCQAPDEGLVSRFSAVFSSLSGSEGEKLPCIDIALRDKLKDILKAGGSVEDCIPLLDFTLSITIKEQCPLHTIFSMLLDLANCSTINQCEELFTYVEGKMARWKSEPFFSKGKNHLLRMCNDILKKLSKSQETVFCGRIQLFLARLFPLTEKSGLNLLSEFNLDNVTVFSAETPVDHVELPPQKQAEHMDTDELGLSLANEAPVDYAFYTKFWTLQNFFREPVLCYGKVEWKRFSSFADTVLETFKSLKLDDAKIQKQKRTLSRLKSVKDQQKFFAKYLTSEKLFNLQLSDSNFRRYVLVQFLILFHYLNSQVKFRSPKLQLADDQQGWVTKASQTVMELLRETPPDGQLFADTIKRVFEMETAWNMWKNEQCPSYIKRTNANETRTRLIVKKRSMVDDLNITNPKTINLGNNELNKLWNLHPDDEAILRSEQRQFVPAIDQYFEDAIMAADPASMVEEQYKDVNKPGWQWRALRLLSKKSRHLFEQTQTPARKIPDYLEDIMRKLAKEITPSGGDHNHGAEEEETLQTAQSQDDDEIEEDETEETASNEDKERKPAAAINEDTSQSVDDEQTESSAAVTVSSLVTIEQLNQIAELIQDKWESLALKHFNVESDDIDYIKTEKKTNLDQANHVLTLWKEMRGKEATADNMKAALQAGGLSDVVTKVFC